MSTQDDLEQVLVIPATLAQQLAPNEYGPVPPGIEKTILDNHTFLWRDDAETKPEFKQVIPYIVVRCLDATVLEPRYLLTQRTDKQQETRLHNLFSIGQGGHINGLDFEGTIDDQPILNGLMREIREEFELAETVSCVPVGIINDNSNDVGKVHLGLVYVLTVKTSDFKVAETGKHISRWATYAELQAVLPDMENWSKILMNQMMPPRP